MDRMSRTINLVAGVLVMLITVSVYAMFLSKGEVPPGHPWSGISLSLLSYITLSIAFHRADGDRGGKVPWTRVVVSVLAIVASIAWLAGSLK